MTRENVSDFVSRNELGKDRQFDGESWFTFFVSNLEYLQKLLARKTLKFEDFSSRLFESEKNFSTK